MDTIIRVAVYINNDIQNYNHQIKCLTQLRTLYTNETIIAVDNNSLNNKWKETANILNINILNNNSDLHRYEVGAYKLALQHFRANKYIFIQGTIFLNNKLDLSLLNNNIPQALAFKTINNGKHYWSDSGINLINKLLLSINFSEWNNYPSIVLWCSFCCNNLFINNMLEDGLFNLQSDTKEHSCAFERIIGYYLNLKLGNIPTICANNYNKIFLAQDIVKYNFDIQYNLNKKVIDFSGCY